MDIVPRLVLLAGQPHMQDELAQRLLRDAIASLRVGRRDASLAFELDLFAEMSIKLSMDERDLLREACRQL